jgi:SAM-dependent methyltransferase
MTHDGGMIESECRSCGESDQGLILSLGCLPLANRLLTHDQLDQPEPRYPLDLVRCARCGLVQITETVPPEQLFREYAYLSSCSDSVLDQARGLVEQLIAQHGLDARSLVIEIGSNDGYLLQYYARAGIPVQGIEPALNVARIAERQRGVPTLPGFFGRRLAQHLCRQNRMADVVHAHNVLAHAADLNSLVSGIRMILKDDGVVVVEVPYLRDLVENVEFDTIYHEHLCYFTLSSLDALFRRHELTIYDVERITAQGGSLRLRIAKHLAPSSSVRDLLAQEQAWERAAPRRDQEFVGRVACLRQELRSLLSRLRSNGHRIAVYGASAKGTVLLNFCGIGRETIDYVVDRNAVKQGRYTPGTHLRIFHPHKLVVDMPEFTLLASWNVAAEVLAQQAEYRRRGGRFIIPIPEVRVA